MCIKLFNFSFIDCSVFLCACLILFNSEDALSSTVFSSKITLETFFVIPEFVYKALKSSDKIGKLEHSIKSWAKYNFRLFAILNILFISSKALIERVPSASKVFVYIVMSSKLSKDGLEAL